MTATQLFVFRPQPFSFLVNLVFSSLLVSTFQLPILVSSFGFTIEAFGFLGFLSALTQMRHPATVGPRRFTDVHRDLNVFRFVIVLFFLREWVISPHPNPQPGGPEGPHFVWPLPFDLFGMCEQVGVLQVGVRDSRRHSSRDH